MLTRILNCPPRRREGAVAPWRCQSLWFVACLLAWCCCGSLPGAVVQAELRAGAAKIDITNRDVPNAPEHLWARALLLTDGTSTVVLLTVDAVAIGEIGPINSQYLQTVREALEQDLQIPPAHVIVNASHCHGIVCRDVDAKSIEVVKQAAQNLTPVRVGWGSGHENRVMENRRLKLKNGEQADVRYAYPLPPDAQVEEIGPTDPQIGLLRLDRMDGRPLAVVFNFACHPILGTPRTAGNTADMTGYAAQVIEDHLDDDTIALFVQGCAGDINPVGYKQVHQPRHAEILGMMLGLSALKAIRQIDCVEQAELRVLNETVRLPRADHRERIERLTQKREKLVDSLSGTSLNLKTYIPLLIKDRLSPEYPAADLHAYKHDELLGREDWSRLDEENRKHLEQYTRNVLLMEEIVRVKTNLALLKKHQAKTEALQLTDVPAELVALRVGEFALITFPGELTVQVGLNIKQAAGQPHTFVAGYTNGYVYYAPTETQLNNPGCAQEDCDCLLGPGWQEKFETRAIEMLSRLRQPAEPR